jgi:hypothetical protein
MLQVFHLDITKIDLDVAYIYKCFRCFHMYVASVSSGYYKNRSGCCIYIQVFQVFSYVYCKCFHLDVAMFCDGYTHAFKYFLVFCKCFKRMLQVFQLFRTYVVSVSSGYYKSRSHVTHVECDPLAAATRTSSSKCPHVVGWCGRRPGSAGPTWACKTSRRGKRGAGTSER